MLTGGKSEKLRTEKRKTTIRSVYVAVLYLFFYIPFDLPVATARCQLLTRREHVNEGEGGERGKIREREKGAPTTNASPAADDFVTSVVRSRR